MVNLSLKERFAIRVFAWCVHHDNGALEQTQLATMQLLERDHLLPKVVCIPQVGYTHKGKLK